MSARTPGRPSPAIARTVIGVIGAAFIVPLLAMLEFTLRRAEGGYGAEHWVALFDPANERKYRVLFEGVGNSALLAVLTLALVLLVFFPTIVLVHLRFPRLQRWLDLLTVLPIAIPAIVLVVGFAPIYRVIGQTVGSGVWTLCFAYGVLVLPFAYRAIVADLSGIDARVRAEAARSLGAGWGTVLVRIIAPGVRRGLLAASLLTIAIVLGEFTVSSLLNRITLQTALLQVSKADPFIAVAVSLLSLVSVFVVLLIVSATGGPPQRRTRGRGPDPDPTAAAVAAAHGALPLNRPLPNSRGALPPLTASPSSSEEAPSAS
ncbi:ABC transporter permease [Leucobacter luti]|uniref:Putative spermidine/putrescine transport system permease protein n=1 Tax=Leucobacter luti TaxID=340320 RepID=A0A4Q7U081_9MICO|nr:ABC transporter permease subunit [Leucobacter luti]RZT66633.1 putative spermidine/putrescine transport system permease protein [Leucobacter luti]